VHSIGRRQLSPEVSAVVVNYNGSAFIKQALLPLFDQDIGEVEVILVDNCSTDGSVGMVEARFQAGILDGLLRIVRLDSNLGFARGANLGFQVAAGKYVACLNSDAFVPSDFARRMVEALESVNGAIAAGCILDTGGSYTRYASAFFRSGYIRAPASFASISRPVYSLAPCGAAAVYHKEGLLSAGGYDGSFVSDWEDHDLGYRLNVLGYRCIHNPGVVVRHVGAGSFGRLDPCRYRRTARNVLLTYYKNCERLNLWKVVAAPFASSSVSIRTRRSGVRVGLELPRRDVAAVKGVFDFLKAVALYRGIRTSIQRRRRTSDRRIARLTSGNVEW
jgi:N-acetylglucosaminyl-diphospho-decaprenol L-rhamnosyltransferase